MKEFDLEEGEQVVRETRKHWFFFCAELLPYILFALVPFVLARILRLWAPTALYAPYVQPNAPYMHVVFGLWLLALWTSAWSTFTLYYLNVWVLTNRRIVEIKQRGYFNREVSSLLLSRVQDTTTDVQGLLESLLGMGDITVQSAGALDKFHMHGIPNPEHMRDLILSTAQTATKDELATDGAQGL